MTGETQIVELLEKTKKALTGLFHVNADYIHEWEKGVYFAIYATPSHRMQSILDVQREILIIGASCKTSGIERAGGVAGASREALMLHFVALQRQIGGCRRTSP